MLLVAAWPDAVLEGLLPPSSAASLPQPKPERCKSAALAWEAVIGTFGTERLSDAGTSALRAAYTTQMHPS